MKRLLPALFLLITAAPIIAQDEGGDGAYIPSYAELVREGYGPREHYYDRYGDYGYYLPLNYGYHLAPKPTQAYYGRGYVIYYGYQMLPVGGDQEESLYAFGHPASYYRQLLPPNIDASNVSDVAVEVRNNSSYQPGSYVAQRRVQTRAITTVQRTTTVTRPAFKTAVSPNAGNLPAVGEKPAH
jgi:hypothetical protein